MGNFKQTRLFNRWYLPAAMIRLPSVALLTALAGSMLLNILIQPALAAEDTVRITVRIKPVQTVIVNGEETITHIINPDSYEPTETQIRRNHIHGEVVDMTPEIMQQYDEIAAEHNLAGSAVVFEREQDLLGRVYGAFVGFFVALLGS